LAQSYGRDVPTCVDVTNRDFPFIQKSRKNFVLYNNCKLKCVLLYEIWTMVLGLI